MESESKLKLKISKMFRSSFGSCKPKNVVDLMENPVFITQNRHDFQQIDQQSLLLSPKARPFPSICKTKSLTESIEVEKRKSFVLQKKIKDIINDDHTTEEVVKGGGGGKKCPPVSPCSPSSNRYYNCYYDFYDNRERKKKPKKKQPAGVKKNMKKKPSLIRLSSSSSNGGWFSSEEDEDENVQEEDETETFFSSRSFSSSSSESQRRKKTNLRRKRAELRRRRCQDVIPDQTATKEDVGLGIGESFAVVKRSSDPHSDFRTSMVEMIIEKQIFSAKDLEKLLQCFLSLNSSHHHRVIVQVFTEIWDALFSNYL